MNNGGATRIKYSKSQMLTAQDFTDQQEYHRDKQKQLLQRFPRGIIGGLEVKCEPKKDDDPNDFDGFKIGQGLAVDRDSNEIAVPANGHKVRATDFKNPDRPYLSLIYAESEELVGDVVCGVTLKNNRINETFKAVWDPAPNMGTHVTVALIVLKVGMTPGPCANYEVHLKDGQGGPRIRLEARMIGNDQISAGAITEEKIKDSAVTPGKLNDTVKEQLVTGGNSHDHDGGDGALIPKGGLHPDVQSELVPGGDSHDHTGVGGATIPEAGLEQAVKDKLVTGGDSHDHTGVGGATIPEAGLKPAVKNKLVTGGDSHDHSGVGTAAIPETGLQLAVKNKLVLGGSLHDHTAGQGAVIPLTGLHAEVQAKLVTGGDSHVHSNGTLITKDGIAAGAVTSDKLKLIADFIEGTVSVGIPMIVTVSGVSPNAIIQVIPTTAGKLSWTFQVEFGSSISLNYIITVVNTGAAGDANVAFKVRAIAFN